MVAFIAGRTAPSGKRMGHAGAIISGGTGTAEDKVAALNKAGIPVAASPTEIPDVLKELMKNRKAKTSSGKSTAKKPRTGKVITGTKRKNKAKAKLKKTVARKKK